MPDTTNTSPSKGRMFGNRANLPRRPPPVDTSTTRAPPSIRSASANFANLLLDYGDPSLDSPPTRGRHTSASSTPRLSHAAATAQMSSVQATRSPTCNPPSASDRASPAHIDPSSEPNDGAHMRHRSSSPDLPLSVSRPKMQDLPEDMEIEDLDGGPMDVDSSPLSSAPSIEPQISQPSTSHHASKRESTPGYYSLPREVRRRAPSPAAPRHQGGFKLALPDSRMRTTVSASPELSEDGGFEMLPGDPNPSGELNLPDDRNRSNQPHHNAYAAQHERQQAHLDAVHRVLQHQAAQQQTQTRAQAKQARMQAKAQQAALERAHVQQQVEQARHLPPQRFSSHLQIAQQPAPQQVHQPLPRPAVSRASMSGRDSGEYSRSASPWAAPRLVPDGRPWPTTAAPHSRPSSGMGGTNFRSRSDQGGYHRNGAPLPTGAAQLQAAAYPPAAQVHSNSHQTAPSVPQPTLPYGVNPMQAPSNQQAGSSRLPANQPARLQASRPTQHQAGDATRYPTMLVNSLRPPGGTSQEAQSLYYGEQGRGVIRGPEAPVGEPPKILSRDERYNKGDFMIVTSDKVEFWVERHHMTHASKEFWDARQRSSDNTTRFLVFTGDSETASTFRDFLHLLLTYELDIPPGVVDSIQLAFRLRRLFQFMQDWGCTNQLKVASTSLRTYLRSADLHVTTGIIVGALTDQPEIVGDTLKRHANAMWANEAGVFEYGFIPDPSTHLLDPHCVPFHGVAFLPKVYIYALSVAWSRAQPRPEGGVDTDQLVLAFSEAYTHAKSFMAGNPNAENGFIQPEYMPRRRREGVISFIEKRQPETPLERRFPPIQAQGQVKPHEAHAQPQDEVLEGGSA